MKKFQLFASMLKINEAARTVTGVIADETVDLAGEIFDYTTSKPHFEAWSGGIAKATDGKSVGNVRAMHGNVVAGKLNELIADDATKSITVTAHIVDDNEWNKITTGCYTGFSIGGKYENKWPDEADSAKKRYTAIPSEVSIVDLPCNPGAQFTVIKADGSEEMRKFVVVEEVTAFDPAALLEMFKNAETIDAVKQLIKDHADNLLDKVAAPSADVQKQAERLFAKLDKAAPVADALTVLLEKEPVEKGMWTVSRLADLLSSLCDINCAVKSEAQYEGDNSPTPGKLSAAVTALGAVFLEMAAEELDEAMAGNGDGSFAYAAGDELGKAADLAKALEAANEKLEKAVSERDEAVAALATYKTNTPAPAKGVVIAKGADGVPTAADSMEALQKKVDEMPEGEEKVKALIKLAHMAPA